MKNTILVIGLVLIALASIPSLIVTVIIGPINMIYSLTLSAASIYIMRKAGRLISFVAALAISISQYFTPVPFWTCVDSGYDFCPSLFQENLRRAEFNIVDAIIIIMFCAGYLLIYRVSQSGDIAKEYGDNALN